MSKFVYVTYIRTTQEKLWAALTTPETMRQYWFGMHQESDWKPEALPWKLVFSKMAAWLTRARCWNSIRPTGSRSNGATNSNRN